MRMKSKSVLSGAGILAGMVFLLGGQVSAQAAVVTVDASNSYQNVGLVSGMGGITNSFDIGSAGTYELKLTDFAFPADPFDTLRLIITSATKDYGRLDGPGSFLFRADPGHYFASLAWDTAGEFDMGLYGIEIAASGIEPTVVPLPSAMAMLMSALGLLAGLMFRRRHASTPAASAPIRAHAI